jgi:hypothetical protein
MEDLKILNKQINIILQRLKPFKLINVSSSLNEIVDSDKLSLTYLFDIDHEKYWVSSPNFDENYFDEVAKLDTYDYDDFLIEIPKYVGIVGVIVKNNEYNHIGKKVYSPLIDLLNSKNLNGSITFDYKSIAPVVTFELFNSDEFKTIDEVANFVEANGVNIDDTRFFDIW